MGTIEREPEVIDNLTSTSTIDALSANQGKVLNDKITTIKKATCTYTTNGYGFVVTNEPISRNVISVYADGPCVFWAWNGQWVFLPIDTGSATTALKAVPNTQTNFVYYYY